jgi:hypothetical protein
MASFKFLWARQISATRVEWNAELVTSDGFVHYTEDGYRIETTSAHSPAAAALVATDPEGAIKLDMQRALDELEARLDVAPAPTLSLKDLVMGATYSDKMALVTLPVAEDVVTPEGG